MNVLYHHRTQGTGAEGVHISYIIKGIRDLGHNLDVVSPNDIEPSQTAGNNPYAQKNSFKAKCMSLLSRLLPQFLFELMELTYNFSASKKLQKILKDKKVQLIYERHAFFLFTGAKLAYKSHIPYIIEVNELAGEKRVRKQFFVKLAKKIDRYVFQKADAIIVVSEFLKERIVELGIDGKKVHVIPNAADELLFVPRGDNTMLKNKFSINPSTTVIGFIGWFVPWHNLEMLIKVFSKICRDKDMMLMLVGDGVLKDKFKALIAEYGIDQKVLFPGAVNYRQIPEYIDAMDICVIPGSNVYRSPIKLFEYMIMGKPVIAPRYKPIEEIVCDQENGLIFTPNDERSLEEQIRLVVEDKTKRDAIGKRARTTILQKHLWSDNTKKVMDIHQEILNRTN